MKLICVGDSPKNNDGRPCYTLSEAISNGKLSLRMSGKEGIVNTLLQTDNDIIIIQQAAVNPGLIRSIRQAKIMIPILIMSRNLSDQEIADTLDAGADDCVDISISPIELLSRIHALVRRSVKSEFNGDAVEIGRMTINEKTNEVFIDESLLPLTKSEFNILNIIGKKKGNIVSREAIFSILYSGRDRPTAKTLDVMIHKIRKKMEDRGIEKPLITNRNMGYYINKKSFTPIGARDTDMYANHLHKERSMPVSSANSITTTVVS